MALCTNNITDFTVKDMVAGPDDYTNLVGAFVCQSTIIPSESKGFRAALSSQSIILADTFLGKFHFVHIYIHEYFSEIMVLITCHCIGIYHR